MFICPPRLHILSLGLLSKLCSTETAFSTSPAAKSSEHVLSLILSPGLCLTALLSSSLAWVCVLGPAYGDQFQFPGWLFGSLALSYSNWLTLKLSGAGSTALFGSASLLLTPALSGSLFSQALSGPGFLCSANKAFALPRSVTYCWSSFFVIPRQLVFHSLRLYWQVRYRSPFWSCVHQFDLVFLQLSSSVYLYSPP